MLQANSDNYTVYFSIPAGSTNAIAFNLPVTLNDRLDPALGQVIILHEPGTIPAIRFRGTPGQSYALQSSPTGLPGTWSTYAVKTAAADGTLDAIEPGAVGQPQRFYRTVLQ